MYIHSCNAHGLCLATTANVKKAWEVRNRQDNEYIYNGTVDLKLHAWDGSGLIDLVQHDEYAYEDMKSYFLPDFIGLGQSLSALPYSSASLNNKNTILLGVDIWLDEKAGLRNDQSVDKTPTYKKITWDPKWGDQPPRNLNTQMQGYASGSSRIWQNGYWLDLEADKLLGNSDYTDIKIRDINDHGMLAAQATNAAGKKCAVFLLPVEIVPDYNRDGMISDADVGQANEETPFVFWVNDDNDDNEIHEYADVPGAGTDGEDMIINGERDLVDFFPVQLRLADILEILPADQYTYAISHATGALNFLEMPTVEPESQREFYGAGSYLANDDMAYEAMGRSDQGKMKSTAGEGSELSGEYLEAAKNGMGVLLIEAKKETEQSFELVICRKSDKSEMARIKDICKLSTKKVEKLYWRADLRPAIYDEPVQDIIGAEDERHVKLLKNRWFVFCHGYNVDQKSARGWNAEMFKRMTQMGFQSKFLGVTWEGNQGQLGGLMGLFLSVTPDYWHNVYNALRSSTHLASAVNSLEGGKVVISGHSLGNMLVGSAICNQGLNAEQYFMLNAAVPREAYSASHAEDDRRLVGHPDWYAKDERLWSTDYWKLFYGTDDNRAKLTWQGQFASLVNQTTPHNYYSKGEDVLKSGDGTVPGLITDVTIKSKSAWIKQEMNKGKLSKKIASGFKQANGGWGQNSKWVNDAPAQNEPLKAEPYFKPFTEFFDSNNIAHSIHGADGSLLANEYLVRNYLLGHDIPALSNPAGSEKVYLGGDIQLQNTDMMAKLKTGNWGDWKHSDLKKQQMGRVWKLYADMITKGKLNKELRPPSIN